MTDWSDIYRVELNQIPKDVLEYAVAVEQVWRALPPADAVLHHARLIMAERERCARMAESHHDDDGTGPDCQGCGELIAAAIRKGG
jgi:hypothetical protein